MTKRGPKRRPIEHGTHKAYALHRYHGEPACVACTEAHRLYSRERYRLRNAVTPDRWRVA